MNKRFWLLTGTQFKNSFFSTNGKRKIPQVALVAVILFAYSLFYTKMFLDTLPPDQTAYVAHYMTYFGTIMIFTFGITSSQGMLFGFKDFDFLMAMPFTRNEIVFSKIMVFVMMEFLYSSVLILPAMIMYGIIMHMPVLFYILIILGFLTMPLIPIVLSSVIGIGLKALTAGKKYGNAMQNAANIILFLAIYVTYMIMANRSDTNISGILNSVGTILFPARWYVDGAVSGNILSVLLSMVLGIVVFAIFIAVYSRTIIRTNEKSMQGYHVENFQIARTKANSPFKALFLKELRTFLKNFMYVFNMAFGMILMVGMSVYLCIQKEQLTQVLSMIAGSAPNIMVLIWELIIVMITFFTQLTDTTCVSISLEGKTLWLMKSLPVSVNQIFLAKILVNLCVTMIPSMISLLLFGFALSLPPLYYLAGFLFLSACTVFNSVLGILINLKFPKLEYDRDIVVIKQSLSCFIGLFVPVAIFMTLAIIFLLNMETVNLFPYYLCGYAIIDIILVRLMMTWGNRKFEALH